MSTPITPALKVSSSQQFADIIAKKANARFGFIKENGDVLLFTVKDLKTEDCSSDEVDFNGTFAPLIALKNLLCPDPIQGSEGRELDSLSGPSDNENHIFDQYNIVIVDPQTGDATIQSNTHKFLYEGFSEQMFLRSNQNGWSPSEDARFEKDPNSVGKCFTQVALRKNQLFEFKVADSNWTDGGYGSKEEIEDGKQIRLSLYHGEGNGNILVKPAASGTYRFELFKTKCENGESCLVKYFKMPSDSGNQLLSEMNELVTEL